MMKIYTILLFLFLGCSQEEKQAEPEQTEPQQTTPSQNEPEQTEPSQIEHEQIESQQTTPPPTDPPQNEPEQTEPQQVDKSYIYGTWKLQATNFWSVELDDYFPTWNEDVRQYSFTFFRDGTFSSVDFRPSCLGVKTKGTFSISRILEDGQNLQILIINDGCPDEPVRQAVYTYSFDQQYLYLIPYNPACPEGCMYRYKKLSDE